MPIDANKLNLSSQPQNNDNNISTNYLGNKVNKGITTNDLNNTEINQNSNENIVTSSLLAAQSQTITSSSTSENKNLPMEVT